MPDVTKLITLGNLQSYDTLIKEYIGEEDAKSLHKVLFDSTNKQIKFYKDADATISDTADFTIDIPADLDSTATIASVSSGVVTLKAGLSEVDGIVTNNSDSDITLDKVATTGAAEDIDYDNTTSGLTATDVQSAIDEVVAGLGTAAAADIATSAITEESTDDSLVSAAQVSAFVATEIAGLEGAMHFVGVITRQTGETDAQAIARVVTSPESGDVVVMSDNAKEYVYDGTAWREVGDETEFVKKTTTIAGVDLQDNITKTELLTALNVADGAQVNVIESVKLNGSALTVDANKAVDIVLDGDDVLYAEGTGGAADITVNDAIDDLYSQIGSGGTVDEKIAAAINALDADLDASGTPQHSGTFVVSGVTEVDGVLTAVDSVEVEAAGAAATAIAALDADLDASGTAAHSGVFVVSGVTQVDGVLTSVDSVEVETAGAAAAAVAALDSNTNTLTAVTDSSLAVITEVGITDGLLASVKKNTLGSAAIHADTDFMASADYTLTTESEIEALFD